MRYTWIIVLSALFITSCSSDKSNESQIIGLASPINLGFESTEIILEDFFIDGEKVRRVTPPDGLSASPIIEGKVSLDGSISDPLAVLSINADGNQYSILLKKSVKQNVELVFDPQGKEYSVVQVKGEMNAWNPNAGELKKDGNVWKISMLINEGIYQYIFVVDGIETVDTMNPESVSNGMGGSNSLLIVGDREKKKPRLESINYTENKVQFRLTDGNKPFIFWENQNLEVSKDGNMYSVQIPSEAKLLDRSFIRAWAFNESNTSNELLIPLNYGEVLDSDEELTRHDFHTWNMYFVLIDRFKDGNKANTRMVDDPDIHPKANYYGGDFAGITQTIKDGYFDKIGINTLWLSPITQNPETAYGLWDQGGPITKFSGYHGYWPVSSSKTDDRYGTKKEFEELLDVAHENGMNVILDYVANHVHEEHPVYQNNPEWATNLYIDGKLNTQLWDEQRLTTWFDTFMPTLDFSKQEVIDTMTDSALYWVKEFDLDGFRHDATKHIQLEFWRTLTRKVKEEVTLKTGKQVYQVGETYGSRELIASYINSGMLDSQFDFGMYDAAVNAFGQNTAFTGLRDQLQESFNYYGNHNLMGYISGNHDKARFITYTSGEVAWSEDAKVAGWTREIGYPKDFAYQRLNMLHAWNMTIPGIPVTYQGDEFGQPGANDPDNRRWMQFEDSELRENERKNREIYAKLTSIRDDKLPLNYGDFVFHLADEHVLAYSRGYFDQQVVVVFNKSDEPQEISIQLRDHFNNQDLQAQFDNEFLVNENELSIILPANSFEILTL
ncbi:MAG: hypothetical protein BalsKO_16860 [Balneolaceae bacterium]